MEEKSDPPNPMGPVPTENTGAYSTDYGGAAVTSPPPPYDYSGAAYGQAMADPKGAPYPPQQYPGPQTAQYPVYPQYPDGKTYPAAGHQPALVVTSVVQPVGTVMMRPQSYLALSCVVFWCVNWIFGAIALCFSFSSSSAADRGDYEGARKSGKTALVLNIIGVIFTIVLVTILVIVLVVVANDY